MGYTIEISLDVRKPNMLIKSVKERREMADYHLCEMQYFMHEIEGQGKTIERNHCIFVTIFEIEQIKDIMNYLRKIRN